MSRLHALVILAWALIRTLLGRMLGGATGARRFFANYAADRLPPATPEERQQLPSMSGCIACGLCDLGGAQRDGAGPMDLALASSRDGSESDAAERGLAALPDALLAERERLCPGHVPLVAVAALVRRRAAAAASMAAKPELA